MARKQPTLLRHFSYSFAVVGFLYKSDSRAVPSQFPVNSHFIEQQKSDVNLYRMISGLL